MGNNKGGMVLRREKLGSMYVERQEEWDGGLAAYELDERRRGLV